MLFDPKHEQHLGMLEAQLRRAQALTPELMSDVIAQTCVRFAACETAAKARIDRLIESGAWTDAALAWSSSSCRNGSFAGSCARTVNGIVAFQGNHSFQLGLMTSRRPVTKSFRWHS